MDMLVTIPHTGLLTYQDAQLVLWFWQCILLPALHLLLKIGDGGLETLLSPIFQNQKCFIEAG